MIPRSRVRPRSTASGEGDEDAFEFDANPAVFLDADIQADAGLSLFGELRFEGGKGGCVRTLAHRPEDSANRVVILNRAAADVDVVVLILLAKPL